ASAGRAPPESGTVTAGASNECRHRALARVAEAAVDGWPAPTTDCQRLVYGRSPVAGDQDSAAGERVAPLPDVQATALQAQTEARRKLVARCDRRAPPLRDLHPYVSVRWEHPPRAVDCERP